MITFADTKNSELISLVNKFLDKTDFKADKSVFLISDKEQEPEIGFDLYVIPFDYEKCNNQKTITYSLTNNKADVVLINIQNHLQNKSFEIMTDANMGRVFINNKNKIEVVNVLMCAAVFYGLGMDLFEILDVLNSILK